jgi:hypothetical protein
MIELLVLGSIAWLLLAVPFAVILGQGIRLADRASTARNRAVGDTPEDYCPLPLPSGHYPCI